MYFVILSYNFNSKAVYFNTSFISIYEILVLLEHNAIFPFELKCFVYEIHFYLLANIAWKIHIYDAFSIGIFCTLWNSLKIKQNIVKYTRRS